MNLRPYQQAALDALTGALRDKDCPAILLEAATGAGKSIIIAKLAEWVHEKSKGGRVLCLAPSAELVKQNHEKYLATGSRASIYSASAGDKCLRWPVVFGTPVTVKNGLEKIRGKVSAIVIDEAHGITPTIKEIIATIRETNPRCRVVGLTATPYRMREGYIFAKWPDGTSVPIEQSHQPFFARLVYRITAWELIEQGYLTNPVVGEALEAYDTSGLELAKTGKYTAETVERAFEGHGRLTASIVSDIVSSAANRRGVLLFCATVAHANEALASLPQGISAIVTGETPKREREKILQKFKRQEIKYIVNVAVLTTGFDAPHVDLVAILRATESPGLLQQIIGRGLRLFDGKRDCLVLDYAGNMVQHFPDGDIFSPDVKNRVAPPGSGLLLVVCPSCGYGNRFRARHNEKGYAIDEEGYFVNAAGKRVEENGGDFPAHHGRRCTGYIEVQGQLEPVQCDHRWAGKDCPECGTENDIAARHCSSCKAELIDPNEKLRIDFVKMKGNPMMRQCDVVRSVSAAETISKAGNQVLRIAWVTDWRKFITYHTPASGSKWRSLFKDFTVRDILGFLETHTPSSVTYQKNASTGFFEILAFNQRPDEEPSP